MNSNSIKKILLFRNYFYVTNKYCDCCHATLVKKHSNFQKEIVYIRNCRIKLSVRNLF